MKSKLLAFYWLLRLIPRYGIRFPFTRTGTIRVEEVRFPLYCRPSLYYLTEHAQGRPYEPSTSRYLIDHYNGRRITFLDIGAYYGYFSSLMGALNPENEVYAFEPNPEYFGVTMRNWSLNCRHGEALQLALSDEKGMIPFSGASMKVDEGETTLRVPSVTFDEWNEDRRIQPDLIKLDVHGSEGRVLFGMKKLLEKGGFEICFELHPQEILSKYTLREIVDLLLQTGWTFSEMVDFRARSSEPRRLGAEDLSVICDPDRWTETEVQSRRMFVCRKESDDLSGTGRVVDEP